MGRVAAPQERGPRYIARVLNLDPAKLLVILAVALVVLGPERLPKTARQIGAAWHTLTNLREQVSEEVRRALPNDLEIPRIPRVGSVTSFINDLTRPAAPPQGGAGTQTGTGGGEGRRSATGDGEVTATGERAPVISVRPRRLRLLPDDPSMN